MKALEKLAEARDKYQPGDLVTIHAVNLGPVAQVLKATKAKLVVRVLDGVGSARRPSWADNLAELEPDAITGGLPADALERLGLPEPPDADEIADKLESYAKNLKAEAGRIGERAKHMADTPRRVAGLIRNRKQRALESAKAAGEQAKACLADSKVYRQAAKALAKLQEQQEAEGQQEGQDETGQADEGQQQAQDTGEPGSGEQAPEGQQGEDETGQKAND